MPTIACPNCGEDEELTGDRDGDAITLTCGACGVQWDRDTVPVAPHPPPGTSGRDLKALRPDH